MLLHNILIYFFFSLHFVFRPPLSLSLSLTLIFLLFSFLKIFSLSSQIFHSNSFIFLLKFSFFSIFSLLYEGLFFCRVGVVGHWRHGHVVGMVGHQFRVMPWVWVCAMVFMGLAVVGHPFHGFMGHAESVVWWVIGIVVMPWVWWVISFGSCRGCGLP